MNRDYPRPLLVDGEVGSITSSTATSLSHPFTRNESGNQRAALIDVGPENHGEEDEIQAAAAAGDCRYSRPFLFLNMIWNATFVLVSVFVLLATVKERPSTPLRLWVFGYALQCLLNVCFVWEGYQRRSLDADGDGDVRSGWRKIFPFSNFSRKSTIKKLESLNTIVSSVWWVLGFYWIGTGGQPLLHDSPHLYWLSVVFLAFDVLFMFFCVAVACIAFLILFCCIPILATVAYAMAIRDRASENDIRSLPRYTYRQNNTFNDEAKQVALTTLPAPDIISPSELFLSPEDSECCICLNKYTDGTELCTLPCKHHFHYGCIAKWLRINATCPLCKFNILRGDLAV